MKANEYQELALTTAKYPEYAKTLYPLLGLAGETHEVFEKLLSVMFPGGLPSGWDQITEKNKQLWHVVHEVASVGKKSELLKKVIRDKNGELPDGCFNAVAEQFKTITDEQRQDLKKEMGDIMWYVAVLSHDLGVDLEDVMKTNLVKLKLRAEVGKIHGSGDNRELEVADIELKN